MGTLWHFLASLTPNPGWLALLCACLFLSLAVRLVWVSIERKLGMGTPTSGILVCLGYATWFAWAGASLLLLPTHHAVSPAGTATVAHVSESMLNYIIGMTVTPLGMAVLVYAERYAYNVTRAMGPLFFVSSLAGFACFADVESLRFGSVAWNDVRLVSQMAFVILFAYLLCRAILMSPLGRQYRLVMRQDRSDRGFMRDSL